MSRKEYEALVIELILNTQKKTSRALNLVQIADKIEILRKELGSLEQVAKKVNISNEMIREFWSIRTLPIEVKKIIEDRKIDSVDVAYRISLLNNKKKQIALSKRIAEEKLASKAVREVVGVLRRNPKMSVKEAIKKYDEIKDIIRYKYIFPLSRFSFKSGKNIEQKICHDIKRKLEKEFGTKSIYECSVFEYLLMIIFTEDGFRRLKEEAKGSGATKKEFIFRLVSS